MFSPILDNTFHSGSLDSHRFGKSLVVFSRQLDNNPASHLFLNFRRLEHGGLLILDVSAYFVQ